MHQIHGQSSGSKSTDEDERRPINFSQTRNKDVNMEKHDRVSEEESSEEEAKKINFAGSTNNQGTYQGFSGGSFYKSHNVLNQS